MYENDVYVMFNVESTVSLSLSLFTGSIMFS